jgi:1-acyl-sn-glycerol-3-phosphate acyltransferase
VFSTLGRYWRVVGTGFSFFVFGLAGLVLGFLVFPILGLVIADEHRRQATSRELLRWCFRCHIAVMRGVGIIRYSFSGLERLDRRGLLIVSNHPSLIDAVLLMAFIRNADCVIDAALFDNKYTRSAVRAAGYIPNQPAGLPLVDACLASLDGGANLLFFPESRRTTPGEPLRLTRGAAQVAVRGGRDVTPVVIYCAPPHLTRGAKWWRVPARRAEYTITVHPDIAVRPFVERFGEPALSARALTEHLHDYLSEELLAHAVA